MALTDRHEWNHLMTSARRHAREQGVRATVVGQRNAYPSAGSNWHYHLYMDATSAARVRSFREQQS